MLLTISALIRRRPLTLHQRERVDFYIAILPWLLGLILFTGGPVLASLIFSVTNWTGMNLAEVKWVGLENFRTLLFDDDLFWIATVNTFIIRLARSRWAPWGALWRFCSIRICPAPRCYAPFTICPRLPAA
ncbi:MAG: hypothetical protein R2911_24480 [Caldilineaceae bacterium]